MCPQNGTGVLKGLKGAFVVDVRFELKTNASSSAVVAIFFVYFKVLRVLWAKGKRLTNRLPNLGLITERCVLTCHAVLVLQITHSTGFY